MKVLSVAWSIYDERLQEFCKVATGGDLAIKNICDYIGKFEESYLLIGRFQLPKMQLGNIHIVKTDYDLKLEQGDLDKCSNLHVNMMVKEFEHALNDIKPDIVNVHGMGDFTRLCIEVCMKKKLPCVYTDHLYVGKTRNFEHYEKTFEYDNAILSIPDLNIVAVSTGMKSKILKDYPQIAPGKVKAIPNGTDFVAERISSDLISKYDLDGFSVLACVGNIMDRKNQLQVVRAFNYLPTNIRNCIKVIFCGSDGMEGRLQEAILAEHLEKQLIYAGKFSNREMKQFYSVADGMILPSHSEGLSIAMLEAIAYGLPIIMYGDSECAEDLNDEEVCSFAENRSDEALAKAIEKWYLKKWDRGYIKKYSKKFTMERVAQDYIDYYKTILKISGRKT
jgi:glycosyltransferase involved in cell wall biosynthesis